MNGKQIFIIAAAITIANLKSFAQTPKLDSMTRVIQAATSDTQRINKIVQKLYLLSFYNYDSTIKLAEETLPLSIKIDYRKGTLIIRNRLMSTYAFKGEFAKSLEQLRILEKGMDLSKDSSEYADVMANYGLFYGLQSKYDSSVQFLERAAAIKESLNSKDDLPGIYQNIAIGFQQRAMYLQALSCQQKGLKLAEENKNQGGRAIGLMNIGNTYSQLKDTIRAEKYFREAIDIAKEKNLTNVQLYGYSNLASLYVRQNRWTETRDYALLAADLARVMGDPNIRVASLAKAITAFGMLGNMKSADSLAALTLKLADSVQQPLPKFQAYSSYGEVLRAQKNYSRSISLIEKGLSYLGAADLYSPDVASVLRAQANNYQTTGDYKKAYEVYKQSSTILDSITRKENIQKATEFTMNNEFEKKNAAAKAEQNKKDLEVQRQKNQQLLITGILGVLVIAVLAIAFLQYRSKRHKQQANLALQQEKDKVDETLSELKSTQAHLIQSEKMASLGSLTAGIAHEIQNPLNFVNNFSEVSSELIDELNSEIAKGDLVEAAAIAGDIKQNLQKITHHGKRADSIVKGMLQHSRTSGGQMEPTKINALAEEYLRLAYHGFRAKEHSYNAKINTAFDDSVGSINIVPQEIGRVLLNLINNAFYATNEKGRQQIEGYEPTIAVSTRKYNNKIELIVSDNGNGIPQANLDKIYQPFFTTKPTGEGTGLGLSLAFDVIKSHGGELRVETKTGEGSTFIVQLPAQQTKISVA